MPFEKPSHRTHLNLPFLRSASTTTTNPSPAASAVEMAASDGHSFHGLAPEIRNKILGYVARSRSINQNGDEVIFTLPKMNVGKTLLFCPAQASRQVRKEFRPLFFGNTFEFDVKLGDSVPGGKMRFEKNLTGVTTSLCATWGFQGGSLRQGSVSWYMDLPHPAVRRMIRFVRFKFPDISTCKSIASWLTPIRCLRELEFVKV